MDLCDHHNKLLVDSVRPASRLLLCRTQGGLAQGRVGVVLYTTFRDVNRLGQSLVALLCWAMTIEMRWTGVRVSELS